MPEPPEDATSLAGRLYDQHGAALYRYALMLLADAAGAEDAVHQVFASLLRAGAGTIAGNPVHYLRRAVRNECYSMLRHQRLRDEHNSQLLELRSGADGDPRERLALEGALRALPPEQREVIHLHLFEGCTFQEIAGATGESINTVASRYRYGLVKLRGVFGC